jgi:aspartyl-tRNA(Asn)/glutamyl-tRNA(Gln) amidotransferase subunit A
MAVLAGRDERDSTSSPVPVPNYPDELAADADAAATVLRGVRLGLPKQYFVKGMEPGVEERVREAVAVLASAGAEIIDVDLPHTDYGLATYYIIAPAEASANLARYDGVRYGRSIRLPGADYIADYKETRGTGFGAEVKRRIMLGTYALSAGYYDAYYLKAQKVRTLIKSDFDTAFEQVDALVAPTSPTVAFPMGARLDDPVAMYLSDACTLPVNMAGLPGLSIPCGLSEGLPVGLQLIGPAWSELELFRLGRGYEAITADAEWRRLEPAELALADDPSTPTASDRPVPRAHA